MNDNEIGYIFYFKKIFFAFLAISACIINNYFLATIIVFFELLDLTFMSRKNKLLFIMFAIWLFISLNVFVPLYWDNSFFDGVIYNNLFYSESYYYTSVLYMIFVTTIYIVMSKKIVQKRDVDLPYVQNDLVFYILIIIEILCAIFGIKRIKADSSYTLNITPVYELTYILTFFSLLFSGKKKHLLIINLLVSLLIIGQDLYYGGRITTLQILLSYYIVFSYKIKFRYLIVPVVLIMIIFVYIGNTRTGSGETFSFKGLVSIDTFYYAYNTSVVNVYASNSYPIITKIKSFLNFLLNIISLDNNSLDVAVLSKNVALHYGGGYFFSYFYFWFNIPGIIISGILLGILLNYLMDYNNLYKKISYSLLLISVFRWYIYSPISLIKYSMIFGPLLFIVLVKLFRINSFEKSNYYGNVGDIIEKN